jgi:hypothetical protein
MALDSYLESIYGLFNRNSRWSLCLENPKRGGGIAAV